MTSLVTAEAGWQAGTNTDGVLTPTDIKDRKDLESRVSGWSIFFVKMFQNWSKNNQKIDEKSMKIRSQKGVKIMFAKIPPKITKKLGQGVKMWSQGWPKASKMRPWSL